ncbi:MAG: hypothetical protein JST08_02995 [Actinobacteria bacterium]|nr:hypothetical protein [Actinomycetota bacterium]
MNDLPAPEEASAALHEAEASRSALAARLVVPPSSLGLLGLAVAAQIALTAVGLGQDQGQALDHVWLVGVGVVVFSVAAGLQLALFRQRSGVWLGGLASRVTFGTSTAASTSYALAMGGAIWAAYEGAWALCAVAAGAGGAAYVLSGLYWVRAYRARPDRHARGEPALLLAAIAAVAIVGLVTLILDH